jgi:hypothetical protein
MARRKSKTTRAHRFPSAARRSDSLSREILESPHATEILDLIESMGPDEALAALSAEPGLLRDVAIKRLARGEWGTGTIPPPRFKRASEIPGYLRTLARWACLGMDVAGSDRGDAERRFAFLETMLGDLGPILEVLAETLETRELPLVEDSVRREVLLDAAEELVAGLNLIQLGKDEFRELTTALRRGLRREAEAKSAARAEARR